MRRLHLVLAVTFATVAATAACDTKNVTPLPEEAGFANDATASFETGTDDSSLPGDDATTEAAADSGASVDASHPQDAMVVDSGAHDSAVVDSSPVDAADASDAGLAPPILVAADPSDPEGLVVAGGNLYIANEGNGTIVSCPTGSCASQAVILAGLTNPQSLATDGTNLYWAGNTAGGGVYSASISACMSGITPCQASVVTIATGLQYPGNVSVDANNVYFTGINTYEGGASDALFACPKSGCPGGGTLPNVLVTGLSMVPSETFVSGSSLYFGQDTLGVQVCTAPACATPTSVQGPSGVNGIVVDGTSIYWADPTSGNVNKCPVAGCGGNAPTVIGSGFGYPNDLATDGTWIYVADGSQNDAGLSNGIWKMAK